MPDIPTVRRTKRKGGGDDQRSSRPPQPEPAAATTVVQGEDPPGVAQRRAARCRPSRRAGVPDLPKRRSRRATCLCQAEWAWTPNHERLGAYYLARGRRHWLLWRGVHNDGTIPWSWEWGIVALVSHEGVEERTAASSLPPTGPSSATTATSIAINSSTTRPISMSVTRKP